MKTRALFFCTLAVALALILTWVVAADEPESGPLTAQAQAADGGPTLKVNLGEEPPSIDPALAADTSSVDVVEQLFIGLVELDDETAEIKPQLATSWTISSDSTVYTFTLRNDVFWTDGNPVTAGDVRYGILRTLDPATGSGYAYSLFDIKNAREYHNGSLGDPSQVGVTAVDTRTLEIAFESPAAYALSLLSLWVARPMPQQAIQAHGVPTWTEPANIVTNGAYRLGEWAHGDHILLTKNPTYYDADNVQIEQVRMEMVDDSTAFQMYQDDQLDTVYVPIPELGNVRSDPVLSQEFVVVPDICTYYYGFTNNKPPFDDPFVRRAFSAAIDRQAMIDDVLKGGQKPANTFAPPGIFGNAAQDPDIAPWALDASLGKEKAQEWLTEAGYPDGTNFPTVTLMHNTYETHHTIAEAIASMWETRLGVEVQIHDQEWGTYLDTIEKTTPLAEMPHVWRLGWCADYADQNNWVHDMFNCEEGANRLRRNCVDETCSACEPSEFDHLTEEASRITDQERRKELYHRAEEILSEEEAAYAPIYYFANQVLTKPYLERVYSSFDGTLGDVADWRITRTSEVVNADGGDLSSDDDETTVQVPEGAFTDTAVVTHTPANGTPPGGELNDIGNVFDLTAVYSDTGQAARVEPGYTYTVTAWYSDTQLGPTMEDTLGLYWWDEGAAWTQQGISSSVNVTDDVVTAQVDHFSLFAVLGETNRIYLPLVLR